MEYLPGGVHGETSKTSKEQRSTVNHVRCFWCGRYLGVVFLTPYVPLTAPGSANGPECLTVDLCSQKPGMFRCRPLPADGGIWYFVDINKKV